MRMRKIRLNPTQWQKLVLQRFNSHCRFTYNAVVDARLSGGAKLNFIDLRNAFVTKTTTERDNEENRKSRKPKRGEDGRPKRTNNPFIEANPFLTYTPVSIRERIVKQCVAGEKAAFTNKARGNIGRFGMGFRSKKGERSWTITLDKRQVHFDGERLVILRDSLCSTKSEYKPDAAVREAAFLRPKKQPTKPLPDETCVRYFEKPPFRGNPAFECSIHYSWGQYYLQVPIERGIKKIPATETKRPVLGVDPGVRDFMATFDSEGVARVVGRHEVDRIAAIDARLSAIQSLAKKASDENDVALLRKLAVQRRKAKRQYYDYKTNFHHQVAAWVSKTYSAVLLRPWDTKAWARSLKPKAVRRMNASGPGLFVSRLREHCLKRGTWFPDVDENYTSKTCCRCGRLHPNLGSSKTYDCVECGSSIDRDVNGAVNVLLKHISFCQIRPDAETRTLGAPHERVERRRGVHDVPP